jgi:TatD DNase family protein
MILIDTHAHIYLEEFESGRAAMLERAVKEGVSEILMPAIDSSEHANMLRLELANPETCRSMMGLHPCYVKENFEEELKLVRGHLEQRPFVAVGEIGLDFYWDKTFTEQQYVAFGKQIEWALEFDIPIAIHSRNATDECIDVVAKFQNGKLRGVFHCFSGDGIQARRIIDLGFYLGIGGVLTFKNSGLDKVIAETRLDRVVLETDAPYLAPVPFRGKRNEPAYLRYVAEKLVDVTRLSLEEVARVTTENARALFSLK